MPFQDRLDTAVQFMKEVRAELRKVAWPKREDVFRATVMTVVATVVLAVYLGFTDFILQNGIRPLFVGSFGVWTLLLTAYFGFVFYVIYLTVKE